MIDIRDQYEILWAVRFGRVRIDDECVLQYSSDRSRAWDVEPLINWALDNDMIDVDYDLVPSINDRGMRAYGDLKCQLAGR